MPSPYERFDAIIADSVSGRVQNMLNSSTTKIASAICISALALGSYWLGARQASGDKPPQTSSAPAAKPAPQSATAVEAARVTAESLAQSIVTVGSLRSDESVIIRPEVSGRIADFSFREGQRVEKGATLVRLDASVQRAELEQAQANLALSKSRLDRARDLHQKGFLSSQASDEAESNFKVAQATYDLVSARLTKLEITAPFAGIVGLRLVSVGDYIREGQDVTNLEDIDTLKVDFRVPEIAMRRVSAGQLLQITVDALPGRTFDGKIFAINPLLDANGRSIVLRASIKNTDSKLRPGMFARVRLLMDEKSEAMTVPEQALIAAGDDFFVYRIVEDRALRTKVELGQRRAGVVEISRGLSKDDTVIIAGQFKIRDGSAVKAIPANAPAAAPLVPKPL